MKVLLTVPLLLITSIGFVFAATPFSIDSDFVRQTFGSKKPVIAGLDLNQTIPLETTEQLGFGWLYASGAADSLFVHTSNDAVGTNYKGDWTVHNISLGNGTLNSNYCIKDFIDSPRSVIKIHNDTIQVQTKGVTGVMSSASFTSEIIEDGNCQFTGGTTTPKRLGIIIHDIDP